MGFGCPADRLCVRTSRWLVATYGRLGHSARNRLRDDPETQHHVVFRMLEDVAVRYVVAGVTGSDRHRGGRAHDGGAEGNEDPGDLPWHGNDGVLPSAFVEWGK